MATAFYNEHDKSAAAWLRALIEAGEIAPGDVDERSIKDVASDDVRGFGRQHYFAGIGGWDAALRLAGWPADRPVWTGSCPCQPYSAAGKQKGNADDRDLWPDFFRLIRECRPECVFGEQVEGAVRHGWLDRVHADLEGEGYAVGSCVLGAHSAGAPHIRQRLYWVAHTKSTGQHQQPRVSGIAATSERGAVGGCRERERVGDPGSNDVGRDAGAAHRAEGEGERSGCELRTGGVESGHASGVRDGLGNADLAGPQGRGVSGRERAGERTVGTGSGETGFAASFWGDSYLIPCRDGKSRRVPVEPGFQPVADGLSAVMDEVWEGGDIRFPLAGAITGRVALLRGAGNAICVPTAAVFVRAFLEATEGVTRG